MKASIFDQGAGPPLVVVPGLHGRWEWAEPWLRYLAAYCRTISYSLAGDLGSGRPRDPALGFDNYVQQLDEVLDRAGLARAVVCGMSFGGFVAVHYAAARPRRVSGLVLASAPGPGFRPSPQQRRWLASPWLSTPAFVASAPIRMWPEIRTAIPNVRGRLSFMARQGIRCAAAPIIPSLMSARMRDASEIDFAEDARHVTAPTLVVSGEEGLDRVVSPSSTQCYLSLIPHAEYRMIERTGHLGYVIEPARVAAVVTEFVHAHHR